MYSYTDHEVLFAFFLPQLAWYATHCSLGAIPVLLRSYCWWTWRPHFRVHKTDGQINLQSALQVSLQVSAALALKSPCKWQFFDSWMCFVVYGSIQGNTNPIVVFAAILICTLLVKLWLHKWKSPAMFGPKSRLRCTASIRFLYFSCKSWTKDDVILF